MLDFNRFDPDEPALYLDDIRTPAPSPYFTWVVVRNHQAFVDHVQTHGLPRFFSLDHDLGAIRIHQGEQAAEAQYLPLPTGFDTAQWLVDYCLDRDCWLPEFTVHSDNPPGVANILGLLNNFRRYQHQEPSGQHVRWPLVTGGSIST